MAKLASNTDTGCKSTPVSPSRHLHVLLSQDPLSKLKDQCCLIREVFIARVRSTLSATIMLAIVSELEQQQLQQSMELNTG